jgi:putative glutamine amidotransferase
MPAPFIGVTLDHETTPTYSPFPWYALRENYFTCLSQHGAIGFGLPHDINCINEYADLLDGLLIPGGNFDIPPRYYGDPNTHETVTLKENRTAFEWAITDAMMAREKPILGICGGEQLLNVILGGSLIQHIPDAIENALEHEQKHCRSLAGHAISITENSKLHKIVGSVEMHVNTSHHQAVRSVAENMRAVAYSPDGVIEAIEHIEHPFCLGVQWHPEYSVDSGDSKIFAAFIAACKARSQS